MKWSRMLSGRQGARVLAFAMFSAGLLMSPALLRAQSDIGGGIVSFGDTFAKADPAPVAQARVIVYRSVSASVAEPVNVYLEGRFHTALLRGGFSEFCLKPGDLSLQTALDDKRRQHLGKRAAGQRLSFTAGKIHFLRVNEGSDPLLQPVQPAQALSELAQTRQQVHVVSRAHLAQPCQAPGPAPVATPTPVPEPVKAPVPRQYALETDALFEFNSAELKASGFNAVEALVQRLKTDFAAVERVRVLGYTDAIGPPAINRRLSEHRAQTVARQLTARGLRPSRGIETEGLGSRELAKLGCGNTPTPVNKACHAPNRRVVIVVIGATR